MGLKLNLKDKKLLYELDINSRQPCSQIAKKIGLSTEVVNYKIKKLEENNIVTNYQTIINLSKLNILIFKICLSLQYLKASKFQEIIEKLKKNNSIKWIVSCKGSWDLIITSETDSIENIGILKDEILSHFKNKINKKAISIVVEAQNYNRDYLVDNESSIKKSRIIMRGNTPLKIDELDLKILKKLSENARKSIVDLASELKSTVRIINYRIKQLQKNKIILGFKMALNYEKTGIKLYKTFIYLNHSEKEQIDSLIKYLQQNKNIVHHVKVLGNWDLEPEFEVYSEKEFDKILADIKDKFSDIIKQIDIITISKEYKFIYF